MTAEFTLRETIKRVSRNRRMNAGIQAMRTRVAEFPSPLCADLAGCAVMPEARAEVTEALTGYWNRYCRVNRYSPQNYSTDEVIIGGGLHAAIYAAGRVAAGYPRPVVLERGTVGGAFAYSERPSFWLNSNNRPGLIGGPGMDQALNYLPGAPVQPSQLSLNEYQTNADLAWVIRVTLAMYATVYVGAEVDNLTRDAGRYELSLANGNRLYAGRVIDARGLGDPNGINECDGDRVLSFPQLLGMMDRTFPLQGMGRVAVIGGGDSGKVAVEALLGIGPSSGMSTAALDYVPSIDWYGRDIPQDCEAWRTDVRRRYGRIGAYLPQPGSERRTRLSVIPSRGTVTKSIGSALVNDRVYDRVVIATGFERKQLGDYDLNYDYSSYQANPGRRGDGTYIAKVVDYSPRGIFQIGPNANLQFTDAEERDSKISRFPANRVSIFRLAPRTAALAANLDAVPVY